MTILVSPVHSESFLPGLWLYLRVLVSTRDYYVAVFRIRISLNADADADPDPGFILMRIRIRIPDSGFWTLKTEMIFKFCTKKFSF